MTIYLDHNATTPVDPQVAAAMAQATTEVFGNPSSLHALGQKARLALHEARDRISGLIGASPEDIVLTGSGTEADNLAVSGVLSAAGGRIKRIVTTAIEHPAVRRTCEAWEARGLSVVFVRPEPNGVVALDIMEKAIDSGPALVSIMLANNDTGAIQPVAEVAAFARERGCVVHCDAIQAVGKIPVDVESLKVDLLSLSAHKLYGPKGIGALYVRPGTRLQPLLHGGGQERGLRPGTESVPLAVGFGLCCKLAQSRLAQDAENLRALRDLFESRVCAELEQVRINAKDAPRLPGTSSLSLRNVLGDSLVMALDLRGIAVSTGSACHSSSGAPPSTLQAMGVPPEWSRGTVRISLGRGTTSEDIDQALCALREASARLGTGARS